MAATYKSIHLVSRPTGDIDPEKQFKLVESPRPTESDLKDGEILIENLYLSLDPAMRGWMNGAFSSLLPCPSPSSNHADTDTLPADRRSYVPPVALNTPMRGGTIARIQASKSADHKPGDHVVCMGNWTEFAIVAGKDTEAVAVPPDGGRLTDVLGPLGMTGMTAYFGLLDVGQPKAGETVVVSGAAGATGSVVCQIAKIKGCRVVGIAGSQDKVQWLRELGCDVALDYKSTEFEREFKEATKEYIDVFFDNGRWPFPLLPNSGVLPTCFSTGPPRALSSLVSLPCLPAGQPPPSSLTQR